MPREDMDRLTPRLQEALELAIELHGKDSRKASPVPALAHLLGVCALVQLDGGGEDEAIAALLHDSLEDKPREITRAEIERRFGARVAALVLAATDTPPDFAGGKKPPWKQRKEGYLARVRAADPGDLRVLVADKVDNLRSILADYARLGEAFWSRFNAGKEEQVWYYRSALAAYRAAGFRGPLVDELERLVGELVAATRAGV